MPNVIVSTCGTSILTSNVDNDVRRLINGNVNASENSLYLEDEAKTSSGYGRMEIANSN